MNRLRSIIVGVDFSPCSASALRQAVRIAKWNQAELHVIHIIEMLAAVDLEAPLSKFHLDIQAGLIRDARSAWARFAADIPEAHDLDLHIEIDHPVVALTRSVRNVAADLLVLGTHGTSEPVRGTGTLATACIRKAMTKVLLIKEGHAGPFRSVVACIDFSETSFRALEQAVRVATQDGARLHVLHVFSGPWNTMWYRTPTPHGTHDSEKQYRDHWEGRLREFCGPLAEDLRSLNVSYQLFEFPKYGRGIIEFAEKEGCDLVLLGTRGRTNVRDMLWGSTAERVVRDAPCSVLAIKVSGFEHPLGTAPAGAAPTGGR